VKHPVWSWPSGLLGDQIRAASARNGTATRRAGSSRTCYSSRKVSVKSQNECNNEPDDPSTIHPKNDRLARRDRLVASEHILRALLGSNADKV